MSLRGKERIEVPVTMDGEALTLAAWKRPRDEGDAIAVSLVDGRSSFEIATIGATRPYEAPSEVYISALPGNMDVMGPHVMATFSPRDRLATVDAMLFDELGNPRDISIEGTVKMRPDVEADLSPRANEADIDGFVRILCSALQACSEGDLDWIEDLRIEVIQGKGRTYLSDGERLIDVTGNSLLFACKQVVDLLTEKALAIRSAAPVHGTRRI